MLAGFLGAVGTLVKFSDALIAGLNCTNGSRIEFESFLLE